MPSISLTDIQKAADRKYGPLTIEGVPGGDVVLVNPLRMSKAKRAKLAKLDADGDTDEKLADIIRLAVDKPADAKRLLDATGGDLTYLAEICQRWTGSAQVGEVSPSAS